ncbi:MAG TPA: sulfatase [Minicystis sp.]|nr:sulfatase [Minicystis sp.]
MDASPSLPPPGGPGAGARVLDAAARGLGVALLASIPAALRTSAAGGRFFDGLVVSAAVLVPLVAAAILLARAAGRGFRSVALGGSPRAIVLGIALWMGLSLGPIALFGALLKATTHHRGLGGAAFGAAALVIAVVAALLSRRLVALGDRLVARGAKPALVAAVGAVIAVVPMLVAAAPLGMNGEGADEAAVRATILDAAIVLVATALASSLDLREPVRRLASLVGAPLAVVAVVVGFARVEVGRGVGRAVHAGGGFAATVLGVFEHWTDNDGDGEGSHFGGHDCDDGDPRRHTGAIEIPGNGVAEDCAGLDAPAPLRAAEVIDLPAPPPGATAIPASTRPGAGAPEPGFARGRDADARPDILLVTLDTVGAGHASAYGYEKPTTPFLAELARRGVLFAHAYASGAEPQRALTPLVSGRRLHATAHDKRPWPTLLPEVDTLAERLERAGYHTAAVTSFTWLSDERGFAQGFRVFRPVFELAHPERQVTGGFAAKEAAKIAADVAHDPHPVFLWVHLFDAHEKYLPHPGIDMGKGKVGAYDGEVAFVDRTVGEIVRAFTEARGAERTAVFVHGSHGEAFGEHHAFGHGGDLYDEVLHVPFVAVVPGGAHGTYEKAAVSTMDLAPTVCELARADRDGFEGVSLAPILRGDFSAAHGPVYARTQKRAALVDWPMKLLVSERHKKTALYDLAQDPAERHDVADERDADVARLSNSLGAFERSGS